MKKLLLPLLFFYSIFSNATDFYSVVGQSDPTILSNWNTLSDGSGVSATVFSNSGDNFIVQVSHLYQTSADWAINGNLIVEGDLIIGGGTVLTISGDFNGNGEVYFAGGITISGNINFNGTWINDTNANTTFNGSTDQNVSITNFKNMTISNNGNTVSLSGNATIAGKLTFTTAGFLNVGDFKLTFNDWIEGNIEGYSSDRFLIINENSTIEINDIAASGGTARIPISFSNLTSDFCGIDFINNDASIRYFYVTACNYLNGTGTCSGGNEAISGGVFRTWNVSSDSTNGTILPYWHSDSELTDFDRTISLLMTNTSYWIPYFPPQSATNWLGSIYYITKTGLNFTTNSIFNVASEPLVLPVDKFDFVNLSIYPNPVKDILTISGKELDIQKISILNILGQDISKNVRKSKKSSNRIEVDLSNLNKGIYFIKSDSFSKKIVKR